MIDRRSFFATAYAVWLRTMAGIMLWVFAHGAWANGSVAMLADNQRLMLPGYIDYLPDSPAIQRDKLLAGEYESSFLRYDDTAVNFQSGAVWLRIKIANQTSEPHQILSLNAMLYTEAEVLYNRASDGEPVDAVNKNAGLLQGKTTEPWPYYDTAFHLEIPQGQTRTVYLRLYTPYIMLLNPYISDEKTYNLYQMNQVAWGHLMTGIMMGVLMYLIMITLFVRGMPEVWYCTSFVAISFLILVYSRGYLFQYMPDTNWVKLHLYAALFSAQAFTYIGFSCQHFKTNEDFPHIDRLLRTGKTLTGVFFVIGLLIPVTWAVMGVATMAFCASILLCVCSVYVWANSTRHLTIYITGTSMFLFVCILVTAESMGYINLGGNGRNAYQAGICLQAILFAAALAERISIYQREQSALAISAAEAQAESRAKSSFLAKMSHELRTPMNGLLGMLQLLEKTPLNQQQSHYMHVMRNSGRILLGVIDDVLDYSRIAAGQLRLHDSDFNIFEEISEIEVMFADSARQKNLQLRFSINPNTPAGVNSDVARLRQILTNLIGNAIKFTERGSVTVRLWIEQSSDEAWLLHGEVEDTGIGITDDQIRNLFREYSQVDGGKNYGGSGLGLVICKQLIEMMQGAIHVESALGYGSVFRFHIAVKPPLQQTTTGSMADRFYSTPVRGTPHVLVAEDNDINSEVIVGMLNQLGYYAASVANGQDAVNAICSESNHWNLVLMDVEMPVLDGLAATQKIRTWEIEHCRNAIPVIALTAHTARTHGDEILKAGMDDYLSKPVDIALLKSLLIRWLPSDAAVAE
jgi:two-component system, sensor histidine kinase LadS